MFRQWNKKIVLILMLALLVACAYITAPASTSAPPTEAIPPNPTTPAQTKGNHPNSSSPAQAGTYVTIKVQEGTTTRSADLYLPAKYANESDNVPLILSFHGYGGSGDSHGRMTGLDTLADENGLLVAYPDGQPIDPNNLKKGLHWDVDTGSPDVKFIRDLVTTLENLHYRVDSSRIYATGMSNGGGMTHRVGCELADIVAAIAPVEGGYAEPGWTVCNPQRPMPVMAFHGTPDPVVPYNGGKGKGPAAGNKFPSITDWAAAWALRDSCNTTPTVTQFNSHVNKKVYSQCHGNASVILFSIDNNGHAWPGSSMPEASQAINATTELWNFLDRKSVV
jgi:polyhydroxybutyrate depolymerase